MVITRVVADKVMPKDSGVCGEFSIYLDNEMCIHQLRVISGAKGLFVAFPHTGDFSRKKGNKRFFDIVHPTTNALRQDIQDRVLDKYFEVVNNI